jgi:hypothetical protein
MKFVSQVLVPLLNMEGSVSVAISTWDEQGCRYTTDPRKLIGKAKQGELLSVIQPSLPEGSRHDFSIMSAPLKKELNRFLDLEWKLVHTQIVDGDAESYSIVEGKVFSSPPYMIIVRGSVGGVPLTLGAYSDSKAGKK